MTDKHSQPMDDKDLDHTNLDRALRRAYPTSPTLPGQFEERVMHEVKAIDHARARQRKVARLMAVYWGIATAIMSGLLAGSPLVEQPAGSAVMAVSLICAICGGGLAWYIARQSGIRLQSLFARTLQ